MSHLRKKLEKNCWKLLSWYPLHTAAKKFQLFSSKIVHTYVHTCFNAEEINHSLKPLLLPIDAKNWRWKKVFFAKTLNFSKLSASFRKQKLQKPLLSFLDVAYTYMKSFPKCTTYLYMYLLLPWFINLQNFLFPFTGIFFTCYWYNHSLNAT
jgi:hypothetical protein